MRTFGTLIAGLVISAAQCAMADAADRQLFADTPSGFGDPTAIVCRAPQKLSDSGALGPRICGANSEWQKLTTHGKDLAADGETIVDRPMVDDPRGDGNRDAVTCRKPLDLGEGMHIRHFGPEFCQTNGYWAELRKNHKYIAANGALVGDRRDASYYYTPTANPYTSLYFYVPTRSGL